MLGKQELFNAVQKHGGYRPASRALDIPASTIRGRLKEFVPELPGNAFVPDISVFPDSHVNNKETIIDESPAPGETSRFILTSAQNNCDVHAGFLRNLKALSEHLLATIRVSCCVYDATGYQGHAKIFQKGRGRPNSVWWDKAIEPYLTNRTVKLHRRLLFCGELDILASTRRPLSGLESYWGRSSIIVPHNCFQMKCVPSRTQQLPKEMHTTGSVTIPRFVQRKTGQVARFHHVVGALLVEVSAEGYWYVHHLNAEEDGSFYWLDKYVSKGKVRRAKKIPAIVLGDIHHEKIQPDQADVITQLLKAFRPTHTIIHDLIDFTSRNYHSIDNPFFRVLVDSQHSSISDDIFQAAHWLERVVQPLTHPIVVASNHDAALKRWVETVDWREDTINAQFYLALASRYVEHVTTKHTIKFSPLEWVVQEYCDKAHKTQFLEMDESCEIEGIECGMHGHIGANGSRGNAGGFAKLGFKSFTAHSHTPQITDGCYTVGVSGNLDMDYNVGPSSWMHTHGIIYPNGKRAFLWIKNNKWRA